MNSTSPNNRPVQGLNALEDQVLRQAHAKGRVTMDSFPGIDPQLIAAAIESLQQKGYLEADIATSHGNKPGYVFAAVSRVLPKGSFYCTGIV